MLLGQGYRWVIGFGDQIRVWNELWLKKRGSVCWNEQYPSNLHNLNVGRLLMTNNKSSNVPHVNDLFDDELEKSIL